MELIIIISSTSRKFTSALKYNKIVFSSYSTPYFLNTCFLWNWSGSVQPQCNIKFSLKGDGTIKCTISTCDCWLQVYYFTVVSGQLLWNIGFASCCYNRWTPSVI